MKQSTPTQELPFQKGIKAYLARTGRTQSSLAKSIFVSPTSIYSWMKGISDPSVTVSLLALEGMTLEEMFGKELAEKLIANSKPKEEPKEAPAEAKDESYSDVQKKGFISKLAALFSAKR